MKKTAIFILIIGLFITGSITAQTTKTKLPSDIAGPIKAPLGQIAFIRGGDLWAMDWDGKNQFKVVTSQNAEGGVSWSPDGRRIAFSRKGKVDVQGPSLMQGGQHSLYDIFIGYLDSAEAKNTQFWRQITFKMGGRYPHWSKDGSKIYCTYDKNANDIDAMFANYQTAWVDTIPENPIHYFRTDSESADSLFLLMPTLGPDGLYAYLIIQSTQKKGIGISRLDKKTMTRGEIGKDVKFMRAVTAPSWSPDGKWLAYVNEDMSNMGIYITSPDLTEKYLVFKPGPGQTVQTYQPSWSPDSKWITFGMGDGSIWIIDITGNGLRQLTGSGLNYCPAWSKHR